ncbi:ABC transporter substrate-binding protein [Micromonospora rosaria]|uniref:Thiamine pyrimidine synthase n=1 Tax=Micromonospora rosaria TaxID=47874 RepID=A0A136PS59_9ACTN|nr:ABC transporter substrate-binding protein [Micromonospora rosaria]KXK61309.1 ABC transporter substrate-binding protein [Micromonospora rosaria]
MSTSEHRARHADPTSARPVDRRSLLRYASLGGLAALTAPLVAGCGDPPATTGTGPDTITYRLSWVKNVQFAAAYIALEQGFYADEGIAGVNLVAGGPAATPVDADVATGKALVGVSAPDITGAAIGRGADLTIVAAEFQKSPFAVVSLADTPIRTPQEMYGRSIGVQAANETTWNAFLRAANLDGTRIRTVPVQFDPLPLTQGEVDGWFSFITDEPNRLRVKGFEVTTFLFADHGYPLVAQTYCVRRDTIEKQRDLVKSFLRAQIRGWRANVADPTLGARLAVEKYGRDLGLDLREQTLAAQSGNDLLVTPDTERHGLLTMTPELVDRNIATLRAAGLPVSADQLFDLSLIEEVHQEDPTLR